MDQPSHQLSMTVLMTPDTANFAGNVHGGTILKLLDQVAYACASRYAQKIRTRNVRHVNSCFFTMVAVDDTRKPVAVKPWLPESDDERRLHAAAVLRKEMRQEMEKRFGELRVGG